MSQAPTLSDVLIAIARLEAKQDQMMSAIERLREETDTHWKKIADLERKIAVMESRQGPRVPWITWAIGVVAIAGLILSVFDRLYIP
jgi:hypothetical protein